MMTSLPPPKLPFLTFILSDHTNRTIACDVAKKLRELDDEIRVWDFLEPIQEAVQLMWPFDVDWRTDPGDPREVASDFKDRVVSLEKWYNENFGPSNLGTQMLEQVENVTEMMDASFVFRDATWIHIQPFLERYKPHQVVIADLNPYRLLTTEITGPNYKPFAKQHLLFASPTVETVVAAILGAVQ